MNFVLRIPGQAIDGRQVCCLGSQLVRIITLLSKPLGNVAWYVADVDTIGEGFRPSTQSLVLVGPSHQLVERLQKVDQFLRGVFMAVNAEVAEPQFRTDIDTEDAVGVDLGDAIVEIRAFDTSYFEVLTGDERIAAFVTENFRVQAVPV